MVDSITPLPSSKFQRLLARTGITIGRTTQVNAIFRLSQTIGHNLNLIYTNTDQIPYELLITRNSCLNIGQ